VVERDGIVDGRGIVPGDVLLGLASSGAHSNGYSLVRKILERTRPDLGADFHGRSLGETLLAPTRIYVQALLKLFASVEVHALAHITGGGLLENLPRVMPLGTQAVIDSQSWTHPPVFTWLQQHGKLADKEMYRTFNCGIGMVVCVAVQHADQALALLKQQGEDAAIIGHIESTTGDDPEPQVIIR